MKLTLMGVEYKRADADDGEIVHTITITTRPRPPGEDEAVGGTDLRPFYTTLAVVLQNAAGVFGGLADAPPERPCKVVPFPMGDGALDPPDGGAS